MSSARVKRTAQRERAHPVRVFVVDDQAMVRRGLRLVFCAQDDLQVCGDAADAQAAFKGIAEIKPDLAVIDLSLRESNGLDLIRRLRAAHPSLRMLVFSMHDASLFAEPARQAGADGYLSKGEGVDRLLARIRELCALTVTGPPTGDDLRDVS